MQKNSENGRLATIMAKLATVSSTAHNAVSSTMSADTRYAKCRQRIPDVSSRKRVRGVGRWEQEANTISNLS